MRDAWRSAASLVLAWGLAACGGNGSSTPDAAPPGPDADTTPDASSAPDGFVGCTALDDYGDLGAVEGAAISQMASTSTTPDYMEFRGDVAGAGVDPDQLVLELFKLDGTPFAADIVPGTYMLSGVNAQYMTCYVCLLIETQVPGSGEVQFYLGTSGTVDITSVSPNLTATGADVTLQHVSIDPQTYVSTPASACTSAITAASFDEAVMPE
jgi:hypothetical protein